MPYVPDWVPEEELALLTGAERAPKRLEIGEAEKIAADIFRDNLPLAAEVICHIALHGEKEGTRLNASKYVVERVMGRTPDAKADAGAQDPLMALFGSVLREPNAEERQAGATVRREAP